MTYFPDGWVLFKVTGNDPHYRVFGSWNSSYTTGSSWRINSGITKVTEDEDYYYFTGFSNSVYKCSKETYGELNSHSITALHDLIEKPEVESLHTIPENIMEIQ